MVDIASLGSIGGAIVGIGTIAGAIYTARLSKRTADGSNFVKQREEDRRQFREMNDALREEMKEIKSDSAQQKRELHEAQAEIIHHSQQLRDAVDYIGMLRSTMRRQGIAIPPAPESLALPRWEEQ